jgi:hypothetical protein
MINVEYTITPKETVNATLDFLSNRPFVAIMFKVMQLSCIALCIAFAAAVYNKAAKPQDLATVIFALGWIFFYKHVNRWIIKGGLKRRKFETAKQQFKIDEKSIFCRWHINTPINIEWKKIKFLLKNKDGYIVPLTGFANAGKFLWLPSRGFESVNSEQSFLELVNKFNLKIKNIK